MKRIFISGILLLCFLTGNSQKVKEKNILKFADQFSEAIIHNDQKKCLRFFEKNYLYEQHDLLLKGNTGQFLTEFITGFSNYHEKTQNGKMFTLNEISGMKYLKTLPNGQNNISIVFEITLKNGQTFILNAPAVISGKKISGFIGAVG